MTDLPRNKDQHEDRVIGSVLHHLLHPGVTACILERPDRRTPSERRFADVTTDALVRLDDIVWSLDVMAAASPASHHIVPRGLHERLTKIAERHCLAIRIEGDSPDKKQLAAIESDVAAAVNEVPEEGCLATHGLCVSWQTVGAGDDPDVRFLAVALEAPSALLAEQIRATLSEPLSRKASKQALTAHKAGCRTAVVIDRTGHQEIAQGTHWLPQHPSTFRSAVGDILDDLDHFLDAVLLLDRDDSLHLLWGDFPSLDIPSHTQTRQPG